MTLRSALLPLVLVLGAVACDNKDDTDDTDLGTDTEAGTDVDPTTITGIAAGDERFSILVEAATRVGLDGVLASPDINYTIFAPNDAAFEALIAAVPNVDSLDDFPDASLTAILAYHGLPTEVMSDSLPERADTLAALTVFFTPDGGINTIPFGETDIDASNGVIHEINGVLIPPNIYQAAQLSGLSTLVTAVDSSSQATQDLVNNPDPLADPITVFAPVNDGFPAELPTEATAFDGILAYHVVDGEVLAADIGAAAPTLGTNDDGQNLSVVFASDDAGATVNNASILITDIKATNGIVHVVDTMLEPGDVVDLAVWGGFGELADALTAQGLVPTLEAGDGLTVFAPTDAAFGALASVPTGQALTDVLTYHVIDGDAGVLSTELSNGDIPTLLSGESVTISVDGGVTVNGVPVAVADIVATNGVVHAIGEVLVPAE